MPVLVTGFEPYGGRSVNPAYEVMRLLDTRIIARETIIGRVLPVSFASLQVSIEAMIDELAPSAIVSLGLSPGESVIRIERLAVNIADFDIADNTGARLRDSHVSADKAVARRATLPVREIEADLLSGGIPARLSLSAGSFLCNACLYTFLHVLEHKAHPCPCGFIHLPYTPEQAATMLDSSRSGQTNEPDRGHAVASMDLSRMVRAVEIAIAATLRATKMRNLL